MFFLAILSTFIAVISSAFVAFGNGMSAPAPFRGGWIIFSAWFVALVLWLNVAFG